MQLGRWWALFGTIAILAAIPTVMAIITPAAFAWALVPSAAGGWLPLLAMALVAKLSGVGALGDLLQPAWLSYNAAVLLRQIIGVGVAALWMSPVVLAAMAAASWLKGWGVPALVASTVVVGIVVKQATGHAVVSDTLTHWFTETLAALMPLARGEAEVKAAIRGGSGLDGFAAWMWADIGVMLRDLAVPAFAAALVVAGIGFALVVLRRAGGLSARLPWAPRAA